MTEPPPFAWLNGQLVPWDKCVLHGRTQGAFWGANVFEGIRAYWSADEGRFHLFRLADHLARLRRSMRCVHMEVDHDDADLQSACVELIRANGFAEDVHLIVVAYFGMGPNLDPLRHTEDTGVYITAVPFPPPPAVRHGAAGCISSWRRISDDTMPPRIKTGANYHNSRLAQHEATRNGYDTTLILNQRGTVAEAPGACIMMVRDGTLVTPPATSGVLEGITVATVTELARAELGRSVTTREIDRTELYVADEMFLCGTVVEVLPIVSLDRIPIGVGVPGTLTRALQRLYQAEVRGKGAHRDWLTPVEPARELSPDG